MLFSAFTFSGAPFGEHFVSGVKNASASVQPRASVVASCIRKVLRDAEIGASSSSTLNAVRVKLTASALEATLSPTASASLTANRGATASLISTTSAAGGYVKTSTALIEPTITFAASGREKWEPIADSPETWGTIPVSSETWITISDSPETWTGLN